MEDRIDMEAYRAMCERVKHLSALPHGAIPSRGLSVFTYAQFSGFFLVTADGVTRLR